MVNKLLISLAAVFMTLIPAAAVHAQSYNGRNISPNGDGITYSVIANAGDSVTLLNIGGQPGNSLTITFNSNVNGNIVIEQSGSIPTPASNGPAGAIYFYYNVTLNSITNGNIGGAVWHFSVPKSWVTEHGLASDNINLFHFSNGSWSKLQTTLTSSTGDTYTYDGAVSSFSPFAIGGAPGLANTGTPYMLAGLVSISALVIVGGLFFMSKTNRKTLETTKK